MQSNGFSFKDQKVYIGIDVHLKSWSIAIMTESGHLEQYSMSPPDVNALQKHLLSKYPEGEYYSVYEAGFCGFSTHYLLQECGIKNIIVNAADVPSSQKESLNKTDKIDAVKLVKALRKDMLRSIHVPDKSTILDRQLLRLRTTIIKDISRWKCRMKHLLYQNGITYPECFKNENTHWNRNFVRWLENDVTFFSTQESEPLKSEIVIYKQMRQELLSVTRKLRALSRTEKYAENMDLLISIPGIAFLTAITFMVEIEDIKRFPNEKEFASFLGLVPTCHSSGEKECKGDITFRANNRLRINLIESSWVASSKDLALAACFSGYIKRMNSNNAIIRIARKLANRIFCVLKNKKKYVNETN